MAGSSGSNKKLSLKNSLAVLREVDPGLMLLPTEVLEAEQPQSYPATLRENSVARQTQGFIQLVPLKLWDVRLREYPSATKPLTLGSVISR